MRASLVVFSQGIIQVEGAVTVPIKQGRGKTSTHKTHVGVLLWIVKTSRRLVQHTDVRYFSTWGWGYHRAAIITFPRTQGPEHSLRDPILQPDPLGGGVDGGPVPDVVLLPHLLHLPAHGVYLRGQGSELGVKPGWVLVILALLTLGATHFHWKSKDF